MKKISRTLAVALVAGLALMAPLKQADAFWWGPWGGGPWSGPWGNPWYGGGPWGGYPYGGYPYYGGPWGGYPVYGAYPGWGYPVASPYLYAPQTTAGTSSTK